MDPQKAGVVVMHIPDGWLSLPVALIAWACTLAALAFALSRFKDHDIRKLSNIGAISAVIFVAQMFNFPIVGGTSGHLLGAGLATFVVGVPGAIIALFTVLTVQALVFADGGVLALGANTFNMGLVGVFVAYLFLWLYRKNFHNQEELNEPAFYGLAFLASLLSVLVASLVAGLELVLSNQGALDTSIPAIAFYHLFIGVGEGLLTVFALVFLVRSEFPLVWFGEHQESSFVDVLRDSNKPLLGLGLVTLVFGFLALVASSNPDGLEKVGEEYLFGEGSAFDLGFFTDYTFLGFEGLAGTILSAVLGFFVVVGILVLPVLFLTERRQQRG